MALAHSFRVVVPFLMFVLVACGLPERAEPMTAPTLLPTLAPTIAPTTAPASPRRPQRQSLRRRNSPSPQRSTPTSARDSS